MKKSNKMSLSISDDDPAVGYLTLPGHQGTKTDAVSRTVCLHELLDDYKGPDVESDRRCVNSADSDPHGLSPLRHGVAHLPGRLFEFRCVVRSR